MSKIWGAESHHDIASIGLADVRGGGGGCFRSLYTAPPGQGSAALRAVGLADQEDPIEQASMEAFAQGFDEGCRVTSETTAAQLAAREQLTAALEMLTPAPSGMLSTMLSATVVRLVEQIVGEVEIDIERLLQRCDTVAAFIENEDGKGALHLNPEDIVMLEGETIAVKLVPDATLKRGCVRLETSDGWVEDGPDIRLSRLRALLDDMEGKP